MGDVDHVFMNDLERRIAQGLTPEMVAASRRRYAILQGAVALALGLDLTFRLAREGPTSLGSLLSMAALFVVLAVSAWRYQRFAPGNRGIRGATDLAAVARQSYRCRDCRTILLPAESECPTCGTVRHPRSTLAFGILFGLGMTALALWRAGFFDK